MKPKIKSRTDLVVGLAMPLFLVSIFVGIFYQAYFVRLAPANIIFAILLLITLFRPKTWRRRQGVMPVFPGWLYLLFIVLLQIGFVSVFLGFNTAMLSIMPAEPKLALTQMLSGHHVIAPVLIWAMYLLLAMMFVERKEVMQKPMTMTQSIAPLFKKGKVPNVINLTADLAMRFAFIFALTNTFSFFAITWVNVIGGHHLLPIVAGFEKEHMVILVFFIMVVIQRGVDRQWNYLAGKTRNLGIWLLIAMFLAVFGLLIIHAGLIIFVVKDVALKQLFIVPVHQVLSVSSALSYAIILWAWFVGYARMMAGAVAALSVGRRYITMIIINMILPLLLTIALLLDRSRQVIFAFLKNDNIQSQLFLVGCILFLGFLIFNKRSAWLAFSGETDATHNKLNPKLKSLKQAMKVCIIYICVALTGMRLTAIFNVYAWTAWIFLVLAGFAYMI